MSNEELRQQLLVDFSGEALAERLTLITSADVDSVVAKGCDRWLSFSMTDDDDIVASIREKLSASGSASPAVVSFLNQLVVDELCKAWAIVTTNQANPDTAAAFRAGSGTEGDPSFFYAIISTPRSGSTYLSELLASLGIGNPEEHLREEEVTLMSALVLDVSDAKRLFRKCVRRLQANKIFGTKIISHFAIALADTRSVPDQFIDDLMQQFKFIYLRRADKVAQAVSTVLAHASNVWHLRRQTDSTLLTERLQIIPFSFEKIFYEYNRIIEEEKQVSEWLSSRDHLTVCYEDLVDNRDVVLSNILQYFGLAQPNPAAAQVIKMDSEVSRDFRLRFISEFTDKFGAAPQVAQTAGV